MFCLRLWCRFVFDSFDRECSMFNVTKWVERHKEKMNEICSVKMGDIDDLNVNVAGAVRSLFIQSADECRGAVIGSMQFDCKQIN